MDINEYFERVSELDKKISYSFYDNYKDFGYDNKQTFEIDVKFLTKNVYDITIDEPLEEKNKRMGQREFRAELIKRYKNCIVTGKPVKLCEACHIVPHNETQNYDVDNGLLLCRELHKLFDDTEQDFKINPNNQRIEFSDSFMNDEGYKDYHKYQGTELKLNEKTIENLKKKYTL
jgi:hypothetical protein